MHISHRAQICGSVRHLRRGLRAALCHLVARAALTFKTIKQCCSLLLRSLLLSSALRQWVSQQQRAGNANPCVCPPCHRLKVRRLEALLPAGPGPTFRSCPTSSGCRGANNLTRSLPSPVCTCTSISPDLPGLESKRSVRVLLFFCSKTHDVWSHKSHSVHFLIYTNNSTPPCVPVHLLRITFMFRPETPKAENNH